MVQESATYLPLLSPARLLMQPLIFWQQKLSLGLSPVQLSKRLLGWRLTVQEHLVLAGRYPDQCTDG